nr:MAG TPA: hypothetical protein [Caudoviricetes sp.]
MLNHLLSIIMASTLIMQKQNLYCSHQKKCVIGTNLLGRRAISWLMRIMRILSSKSLQMIHIQPL